MDSRSRIAARFVHVGFPSWCHSGGMPGPLVPSSSDPLLPRAFPAAKRVKGDADLHDGPLEGPDILEGTDDSEAPFESRTLNRNLPIRKPQIGEKLSIDELETEIGAEPGSSE